MALRGITNRGKIANAKTDNNTVGVIGGGNYVQKEERQRTKQGAIRSIFHKGNFNRARITEDSRICARHVLPKVVFTKVISRKFQVPPVIWRLALCSVSISARRFRTVRPDISPR